MQCIKDCRPWYRKGKVMELALSDSRGVGYRHPVRPYTGDDCDNSLVHSLMRKGYTVVVADYGYKYDIPDVYNDILKIGEQLCIKLEY